MQTRSVIIKGTTSCTLTHLTLCVLSVAAAGCENSTPSLSLPDESATAVEAAVIFSDNSRTLPSGTRFFVRKPDADAVNQFVDLIRSREFGDAVRLGAMEATPQALWFTGGSPGEVETAVRKVMRKAAAENRVPVLVAYDIPFRDCAGFSAGGAADTASYEEWIDAFARGIGNGKAVVILEPDSLGIIPYNTTLFGATEWCQPTVTDPLGNISPAPGASPTERYAQLNYAVDSIGGKAARALIYLDGTHSAWLGVGEAAYRLFTAGVQRSQGFFLNVSNFQSSSDNAQFGTWVSDCITAATAGAPWAAGHFDWCPSQYDPATNYQSVNYSPEFAATVTAGLVNLMGGTAATTHFVIDTSRNGQGAWTPTATYPDAQSWCNPPHRGLGVRPTAATGVPLIDASLWIKAPGESDGSCNRGTIGSTTDPEWAGVVDPTAGTWFPQQALDLAALANPPLL